MKTNTVKILSVGVVSLIVVTVFAPSFLPAQSQNPRASEAVNEALVALDAFLDVKIPQVAAGARLSSGETNECQLLYDEFWNALCKTYGNANMAKWRTEDVARHYVEGIRMAIVHPQQHGGWPTQHGLGWRRVQLTAIPRTNDSCV